MREPTYLPRVVLCVRSLCPAGAADRQTEVIERLRTMDEGRRIAAFTVEVWGDRIPCTGRTGVGRSLLERIDAFEEWSERAGTSVSRFFQRREHGSMVTDGTREVVVPPVLCLAEYRDDTLQYVTPCVDDGRVRTVRDHLDTIERESRDVTRQKTLSG